MYLSICLKYGETRWIIQNKAIKHSTKRMRNVNSDTNRHLIRLPQKLAFVYSNLLCTWNLLTWIVFSWKRLESPEEEEVIWWCFERNTCIRVTNQLMILLQRTIYLRKFILYIYEIFDYKIISFAHLYIAAKELRNCDKFIKSAKTQKDYE